MDLRSLTVFIETAELGSFTRAAEKLGYSQPTVSFHIKQLEQELGIRLFDRIGHRVTLTDAGHSALSYAQEICRLRQEMESGSTLHQEPGGILRLGMADSLCAPLIAAHMEAFRRKYPRVSIHIATGGTGDLFQLLDHNEVDLVCTLDVHAYDTNYVIADEEPVEVHVVAAADHPLASFGKLKLGDLMGYPFLLTEKGVSYRRLLDERLARDNLSIQPVLETGRADLICSLVRSGVGLSFLPDYVTEEAVQAGKLVRLEVADFEVVVWKQLLYRREKWLSAQMRAMLEHLGAIRLTPQQ